MLEVYILLALNLCRYAQIARNKNVYVTNVRLLVLTHWVIYLMPLISFIIQILTGWAQIEQYIGESCDVGYTNVYAQIFNTIIAFALPIILNILVIYASIHHVHLTTRLRRAQHHVSAREKYHRSLVIQFLIFYTVWLLLWSPNIITFQLKNRNNNITMITQLLNYIEIVLDPIIIGALDVRFRHVWRDIWKYLKKKSCIQLDRNRRRIKPITTSQILQIPHQIQETPV